MPPIIDEKKKRDQRTNIYAPGSTLAKAQDRQINAGTNIANNVARGVERTLTAPVGREAVANLARGTARGAVGAVLPAMNRQREALDQPPIENPIAPPPAPTTPVNTSGTAVAATLPDNQAGQPSTRGLGAEPPMTASHGPGTTTAAGIEPPANFRSPHNGIGMSSDGFLAYTGPDGNIRVRTDGRWNAANQRAGRGLGAERPTRQVNADGYQRVGNMDVAFGADTSPEARARFMQNPVRPSAQIANSEARRNMPGPNQVNYSGDRGLGAERPQLFTAENSPNMGWKTRRDLNRQLLANANSVQTTGMRNDAELARAGMTDRTARRGQDINAENYASQNAVRQSEIASNQFDLEQKQALADLETRYAAETDPEKRKQLENEIYARRGKPQQKYQIATRKGLASDGITPEEVPYIVDSDGTARPIGSGGIDGENNTINTLKGNERPTNPGWYMTPRGVMYYGDDGKYYATRPTAIQG